MAKRKRSRKATASAEAQRCHSDRADWNEVEQAFFASAPPDEPVAIPAESFEDDLIPARQSRPDLIRLLRRFVDGLSRLELDRRFITIAIATFMLLIGLSAAVFASWH
jgi:hypothetical protein